jgi:glycyl-tRNA synthetase beta chain
MDAPVPRTVEGSVLAIADKADTISGMFGLGLEPTGSKDPFALRRAANGIVKILSESGLPLTLGEVAAATGADVAVVAKIVAFFAERLEFYLREARGQAYDVVAAVLAVGANDVRDVIARAEALTAVRGGEDFLAVSAAFKRMSNILDQARDKGYSIEEGIRLQMVPAEEDLKNASSLIGDRLLQFIEQRDYIPAFQLISTLRPQVDQYFESVMVMDPDSVVRSSRLFILHLIVSDIRKIADLSKIVMAG